MTPEERILSLGSPVEDFDFINLLRSRLFVLLKLTRNPDMFPGSQPVSFEQRHLETLEREDYYVCEKSDGVRYLLYFAIPPSGPVAFLIDRNYGFRALDHLTLPTRDLRGFQEETLLDGELVWDERKEEMVYYIFDGLMFNARNLCSLDLNGRLQVIQNDVIGPLAARTKRNADNTQNFNVYEQEFPFKMRMKQMWKPYGLRELFERVIPLQGHENDGLIFTPIKDAYQAGTCHRLLKWKPSEMNTIDFMISKGLGSSKWQLDIATQGRVHYYMDFDPQADETLMKTLGGEDVNTLEGRIAEFRLVNSDTWQFMRFRPDKRLPNDSKTVEKVLQSIRDNVKRDDLLQREAQIRANWKQRESGGGVNTGAIRAGSINSNGIKKPEAKIDDGTKKMLSANNNDNDNCEIVPRSQLIENVPFKYPLNLRTAEAKAAYQEYDGWYTEDIYEEKISEEESSRKRSKVSE